MREIEVKARVENKDALLKKLEDLSCALGETKVQNDVVYVQEYGSMEQFLSNELFLRIRESNNKILFTVKYHKDRTQNGNALDMPLEHEVEVSSRSELESMLVLLGFFPALNITKRRQTGHYKDWEICIDEVEGLGSFIEVEQLTHADEDIQPVTDAISSFLSTLGISPKDIGAKRYDIALLEKQYGS